MAKLTCQLNGTVTNILILLLVVGCIYLFYTYVIEDNKKIEPYVTASSWDIQDASKITSGGSSYSQRGGYPPQGGYPQRGGYPQQDGHPQQSNNNPWCSPWPECSGTPSTSTNTTNIDTTTSYSGGSTQGNNYFNQLNNILRTNTGRILGFFRENKDNQSGQIPTSTKSGVSNQLLITTLLSPDNAINYQPRTSKFNNGSQSTSSTGNCEVNSEAISYSYPSVSNSAVQKLISDYGVNCPKLSSASACTVKQKNAKSPLCKWIPPDGYCEVDPDALNKSYGSNSPLYYNAFAINCPNEQTKKAVYGNTKDCQVSSM